MIVLIVAFVAVLTSLEISGFLLPELHQRVWRNVLDRAGGPLSFRLWLQPAMGVLLAFYESTRKRPALETAPNERTHMRDGLVTTARVLALAIAMDVIYQLSVLKTVYPGEAILVAVPLAVAPFFLTRWLLEMWSRRER